MQDYSAAFVATVGLPWDSGLLSRGSRSDAMVAWHLASNSNDVGGKILSLLFKSQGFANVTSLVTSHARSTPANTVVKSS
jgi:hypothetical protein